MSLYNSFEGLTVELLEDLGIEGVGSSETINGVNFEVVEVGEWEQDHKTQSQMIIITDGTKFYRGWNGRSGSHHSGWDYDSSIYGSDDLADLEEVVREQILTTVWRLPK